MFGASVPRASTLVPRTVPRAGRGHTRRAPEDGERAACHQVRVEGEDRPLPRASPELGARSRLAEQPGQRGGQCTRVLRRDDEGVGARRAALAALGYIQDARLPDEIRRALADPELRLSAIQAIGRTANPEWLGTLSKEATDADARVREETARACGEMADQRAVPLATDLLEDRVLDVRLAAIRALGQIGGEEARDALIYALEDEREAIRDAAASALAEMDADENPLAL